MRWFSQRILRCIAGGVPLGMGVLLGIGGLGYLGSSPDPGCEFPASGRMIENNLIQLI